MDVIIPWIFISLNLPYSFPGSSHAITFVFLRFKHKIPQAYCPWVVYFHWNSIKFSALNFRTYLPDSFSKEATIVKNSLLRWQESAGLSASIVSSIVDSQWIQPKYLVCHYAQATFQEIPNCLLSPTYNHIYLLVDYTAGAGSVQPVGCEDIRGELIKC